jgi:hypothetical protein
MSKDVLSFRVGQQMSKIVQSCADKRGISQGEMLRVILRENMADYKELSELEQQYAEIVEQERQEELQQKVTKRKMKKATFMNYVRSQVKKLRANGATKQECMDILNSMKPIAKRRDKIGMLDGYIEDFKQGNTQENEVQQGEVIYEH